MRTGIINRIDALILSVYSSPLLRKAAGAVLRLVPRMDIAVRSREGVLHTDSPDRLIAALLWKYRMSSSAEYAVYVSCIKPGMTVLDIGANVGFLTLLFSRLAGPSGRVIALEPDPENFRLLSRNVSENGRANVSCENLAAASSDGVLKLFRSPEHRGDHRVYDTGDGRETMTVRAAAIDTILGPGGRADFIKMDIQGAEMMALGGMKRTLANSQFVKVLCEFSPAMLRGCGSRPEDLLAAFSDLGFTISYLDEDSRTVRKAGEAEIMAMCPGDKYLNLLLERS